MTEFDARQRLRHDGRSPSLDEGALPRHCAACGAGLIEFVDEGGWRRKRCGDCGWKWYNNPLPVVLVLGVTGDGHVLFTRKSSWPEGMWGLVSGIVEDGETPEQTVIREVAEESGMRAIDPVYVGSDVLPGQLLLCFTCRLVGDEARAGDDVDEVVLAAPDPRRIPEGVPARRLLDRFLAGQRRI